MKTRMQPVARVFDPIPRMVRDLCQATGKRVSCHVEGTATEIDKALVEVIRDPVVHMVRNAIDHGIEPHETRLAKGKLPVGTLSIRAAHESGMVKIEIEDDGRGIDPDKLRAKAVEKGLITAAEAAALSDREALELVYRSGFSTADKVTEISGRGVGMDVVRNHVEREGGQVELDSVVGKGTVMRLKMPLTLAIIQALLVRVGKQRFAIPQASLVDLVYLNETQAATSIEHVRDAAVYRWRGQLLPLVRLDSLFKLRPAVEGQARQSGLLQGPTAPPDENVSIVVVAARQRRYGLIVDEIEDTEEIVIKPISSELRRLACYSGATVLGDGSVALILEAQGIAAMSGIDLFSSTSRAAPSTKGAEEGARGQSFVLFHAGDRALMAVPLRMVSRLEHVPRAGIERVAGAEVVQYRGSILPVVRPEAVLPIGRTSAPPSEIQPLIVFDFGHRVGMAVDEILDIVTLTLESDSSDGSTPATLGKAVVLGRTALVLDVYDIVRRLAPQFVFERRKGERPPRLLVADDSNAMRTALAGYLRTQGFEVHDVSSGDDALRELRAQRGRYDAVVTDLAMEGLDGFGLIRTLQQEQPQLPVFAWTYQDDVGVTERALSVGARACVHKLRREELVAALQDCGIAGGRRANDGRRDA